LRIEGSYGLLWIVHSKYIAVTYLLAVATSRANSPNNAVSVWEHTNAAYQACAPFPATNPVTLCEMRSGHAALVWAPVPEVQQQ
jgi:membrane-associated phospholipid phosphatase